MEGQIFTRLEKSNIFLEDPGNSIKIDHLKEDTKEELTKIFDQYSKAFAVDSFDCGNYVGLIIHLDVLENKTAYQREQNMKSADVQMIKPIMEKSLAAGIFEPNSIGTNNCIANLNCVSKPSPEIQEFSKADKEINKSLGIKSNKSRICIDLRSLNAILGETPKVRMPRTDFLKNNSFLSSFDLTQFFLWY